ncbi:MAG TPA: hypothetical protein VMB47_03295 [Candidatus Aquilonibacter sp.]|nr:hypothetical protein [Candidatus Aquilonibacter sp.]
MKTNTEETAKSGKIAAIILGSDFMGMLIAIIVIAAIAAYVMHGGHVVEATTALHQIPYPQ